MGDKNGFGCEGTIRGWHLGQPHGWNVLASPEGVQDILNLAAKVAQQTEVIASRFAGPRGPKGGIHVVLENATPAQTEAFYRDEGERWAAGSDANRGWAPCPGQGWHRNQRPLQLHSAKS